MKPLLYDSLERPLVSIIIPCYNAERWLSHAILSCLEQTYRPLEIIVIDDGSTDGSLDIIKSYDKVITWETGPNRGGNAARNRGFELSKGEYIQFLDADDYLLPEKIARQVSCLEETETDGVYGDWQYRYDAVDGTSRVSEPFRPGKQKDVLNALLSGYWWIPPNALLWRRTAVEQSGGWDEHIQAGQDKDFFLSVLLAGARVVYQPGCLSIYRRSSSNTVSTTNPKRWFTNHAAILEKAEETLATSNRLTPERRRILASVYFPFARYYYDIDRAQYERLLQKTRTLYPEFRPIDAWPPMSLSYILLQTLFGFSGADWIAGSRRRLLRQLHTLFKPTR